MPPYKWKPGSRGRIPTKNVNKRTGKPYPQHRTAAGWYTTPSFKPGRKRNRWTFTLSNKEHWMLGFVASYYGEALSRMVGILAREAYKLLKAKDDTLLSIDAIPE